MTRIKQLRINRGLSLGKVVDLTGVSKTWLWETEEGLVSPSADRLKKICDLYGVSLDYAMGEFELDEEDHNFIKEFYAMDSETRRRIREIAKVL